MVSKWAASWENRIFAYAKTKGQISFVVNAKLISTFVFPTRIVQSLFFLIPKFQASSHLLWLYSPVCVGNPEDWFSHNEAQITQGRQYRKLNENEQQNKPQKNYRLGNDGNKQLGGLLAHLSQRLIGELVGYPWSSVRPSSSVGVVHNVQTSFSPKLLVQSKPDCMWILLG